MWHVPHRCVKAEVPQKSLPNEAKYYHVPPFLSGRDVSNGTFRIDATRHAFVRAARKLEALARGRRMTDGSINYLSVRGGCLFWGAMCVGHAYFAHPVPMLLGCIPVAYQEL